jgi:ketosteroid isomerase-like protein
LSSCSDEDYNVTLASQNYAAFSALNPFFNVIEIGLAGLVDGDHFFDTLAQDVVFEFQYIFPRWPEIVTGRAQLMALFEGYGKGIHLQASGGLVVHKSDNPGVVILEYVVQGKTVAAGAEYVNRFASIITIKDRKIVHWRDYMDSFAAMTALSAGK